VLDRIGLKKNLQKAHDEKEAPIYIGAQRVDQYFS
jgi:hypothetical protein